MMLKGKTAIITGAAQGIGRAIALKLAKQGVNILVNDINRAMAEKTAEEIHSLGVDVITVICDVRDADAVNAMVKRTTESFGTIDILVNNAGITRDKLLLKMSEEDWDEVLDVNLKGAFNMTKAVCKVMLRQKSGSIINIASVSGEAGNVGQANYSASKGGLIALTKTTAKELAKKGIRVNAIAPGFVVSEMTDKLSPEVKARYIEQIPVGKFATAEDIANAAVFLAGDASSYITGQVIRVDGGLIT